MTNPQDPGATHAASNGTPERSSLLLGATTGARGGNHGPTVLAGDPSHARADSEKLSTAGHRRSLTGARRKRLASLSLVLVLCGAGAGYATALLSPPVYAARADILYRITQVTGGSLRQDPSLTTQIALLASRQVLGPVAARDGVPVELLQQNVSISVLGNTEIIELEARDRVRNKALRLAQDIVDTYVRASSTNDASDVDTLLDAQLAGVDADLTKAREKLLPLTGLPAGNPELVSAESAEQSLSQREQALRSEQDNLALTKLQAPRGKVVVAPYSVAEPVSPQPVFDAGTGALAGLVIAVIAAAVRARRWTRV